VERLGTDPGQVANSLIDRISEPQRQEWSSATPADWVMEAFALARRDAYGLLPPPVDRAIYSLPSAHTEQATRDVTLQPQSSRGAACDGLEPGVGSAQN
jgi:hypothetical protein